MIFSYTLVTLLSPHRSKKNNIIFKIHCLVIILFLIGYALLVSFYNDPILSTRSSIAHTILNPITDLRIAFFVFYLYQILQYSLVFRKALRRYNTSIDNYFSETGTIQLKWIKIAFFSALIIGLFAVIFQTLPSLLFDNIFTTILVVFYTAFALNFINYKKIYHIIEPAFDNEMHIETGLPYTKPGWDFYKQKILENKIYLKEGLTLTELAQSISVSRSALTIYINIEENQNFNAWINYLRISEAKKGEVQ